MKIFITILILIFALQTPSQADDIRDFQIEGMSIGDSLLDYFSKSKIEKDKKYIYKSKKFISFTDIKTKYRDYDFVQFHYKNKDKKYLIQDLTGTLIMKNNMTGCIKKKDTIVNDISNFFKNTKIKNESGKHGYDKLGESLHNTTFFIFDSENRASVSCTDWSKKITKKNNWPDRLKVTLTSKEFRHFINFEAYK